jgi:nucleoside-diphosphate-sugar epimerase
VQNPYNDFRQTVEVCAFVLEAIRTCAPKCRFVLLSSASVYGNPVALPIHETSPTAPVSPYGYHKLLCETLVEEYAVLHGVKTAVLRIFSAYGERQSKQVIYDICQKNIDSESFSVELFGTGKESRDFIHAQDIAHAIECIYESEVTGTFNVASGVQTTIEELLHILEQLFGNSKKVVFSRNVRQGDPLNWQASIKKLESIGFCQSVELSQGLAEYVTWFQSQFYSRGKVKS